MFKFNFTIVLLLLSLIGYSQLKLDVDNYNQEVLLARYMNGKAYPVDTLDGNGSYIYSGEELANGIYLFVMNDKYLEFPLGNCQQLDLSCDYKADNIQESLIVNGCLDNQKFNEFLAQNSPDEMAKYANETLPSMKDEFLKAYMRALIPIIPPSGGNDRENFFYFRKHFWNQVDFMLPELLNSPLLSGKLDYFFKRMIPQQPDSVIIQMESLLNRPMADTIKTTVLAYLLPFTFESKVMGMEKAFVWLAENYFVDGKANWIDAETMNTIEEQYYLNRYCLVGNKGYNLKLTDHNGASFDLYQSNADYTLLLFYDISCGSCKKVVEQLKENSSKLFLAGVDVVALNTEQNRQKWQDYIQTQEIDQWHNVMDQEGTSNFFTLYGIQSTPTIYLLDKDKTILAKKLTVDQVFEVINHQTNLK